MTLLTLASKQIWPQVLAVAHLKPTQLVLLHTDHSEESRLPAQRLKRLFEDSGLVPKGGIRLEEIPDSDFPGIERRLDDIQRSRQIPLDESIVNITGGNKLMATAAFRWGVRHSRAFYLERRNQLIWFTAPDGVMKTATETLDGHITDDLDPVALLRCQLHASEVERPGESLVLNPKVSTMKTEALLRRIQGGEDARGFLTITGEADRKEKDGDTLELTTAAALLALGVKRVQRSLRLKVKSAANVGTRNSHAEIDLIFTFGGRLWVVDCKDQQPLDKLTERLIRQLPKGLSNDTLEILNRIQNELSIGQTKALKQDLLAVQEAGGLLGNVICVRKSALPEEVLQFAKHNQINVVFKSDLVEGLQRLLFPDRGATAQDLAGLVNQFKR